MRRLALILPIMAAAVVLLLGTGANGDGERYRVRAVFDSAAFLVKGEDVKIAGVRVGKIDAVEVTGDLRAAVVLDIEEPGFQDFRADASCTIRPQSLIGEQFVECAPTQPRPQGEPLPPALERIGEGERGEGQYLLPVENTSTPVGLDLINEAFRRPYAERFSLIINELGTALAGRGEDLGQVIRRSNPAFKELDRVLQLLARQNRTLQQLAEDSHTVLAPLARDRKRVTSFIRHAGNVAEATAERREDLRGQLRALPTFLRELTPTMQELGGFSDQFTPVLADLQVIAPDLDRFLRELGPFSRAAETSFVTLGEAAEIGTPAVRDARPTIARLRGLATQLRPVGRTLREVLVSFQRNQGVERLMDYIFYQVAAINGFDSLGHYLRANLIANNCVSYATEPASGCESKFTFGRTEANPSARAATVRNADPVLENTRKVLGGADPADLLSAEEREANAAAAELPRRIDVDEARETGGALFDYLLGADE